MRGLILGLGLILLLPVKVWATEDTYTSSDTWT